MAFAYLSTSGQCDEKAYSRCEFRGQPAPLWACGRCLAEITRPWGTSDAAEDIAILLPDFRSVSCWPPLSLQLRSAPMPAPRNCCAPGR